MFHVCLRVRNVGLLPKPFPSRPAGLRRDALDLLRGEVLDVDLQHKKARGRGPELVREDRHTQRAICQGRGLAAGLCDGVL